jgi:hypothetical protein
MGERRGIYRVLMGKSKEKGLFGRPRHRWEDDDDDDNNNNNNNMDL